jgi:hypothetical protein
VVEKLRRVQFRETERPHDSVERYELAFFRRRRVEPLLERDDCDVVGSVFVGILVMSDDALVSML